MRNKEKRTFDGIIFDSAGEMRMYRDYLLPQMEAGFIRKIDRQYEFILQEAFEYQGKKVRPITYVADFVVEFACGQRIVFDFKGMPDTVACLKRKMFQYRYKYPFYWIAYSKVDGGFLPYEVIQANRKRRRKERQNKE